MSVFTGYNPNKVKDLRKSVNSNIAPRVADSIINNLKSKVVTPISTAWYTPEGKEYFAAFAEAVQKTGPVIKDIFDAFIKGLEVAANNWADNVKAEKISLAGIDSLKLRLAVDAIKDKNNSGDIGIDAGAATSVANNTSQVRQNIESELRTLSRNLSADTAFLGAGQAAAVEGCFTKIQDEVAKIFNFLSEDGEGQSLKSAIKSAVEKYGDVGSKTSSYFNG